MLINMLLLVWAFRKSVSGRPTFSMFYLWTKVISLRYEIVLVYIATRCYTIGYNVTTIEKQKPVAQNKKREYFNQ